MRETHLVRMAQNGDETAAVTLVERHYRRIYAYLRRLSPDAATAEDLTQETFLKAWVALPSYRHSCRFSTWLYSIAYHAFVDRHRRDARTERRDEPWWEALAADGDDPYSTAARNGEGLALYEAVHRLDDDKRQTIVLHYYEGLSLRETARVLGVAPSTVKYRLSQGLALLRSGMADEPRVCSTEMHEEEEST